MTGQLKHAKLSASGAHRWMECPGSVAAEADLPETSSVFAEEGTAAHELGEITLKGSGDCSLWVGKTLPESRWEVTAEMADYVQIYVDYVKGLGGTTLVERRVDFSEWVPEGFGTSDAICIVHETIYCCDLKYGKGVMVHADNNYQAMLYALGVYSDYSHITNIKRVVPVIIQPRLDHISVGEPVDVADLLKFGEFARAKAEEALSDKAKRVAGEKQCQFCKAKATCQELKNVTEKTILTSFDQIDEAPPVNRLNNEQLRIALDNKKLIISWLDAVESLVNEKLVSGETFEGYKLVEGRSLREWADEIEAFNVLTELLGEEAYVKKMLSVTQAEKVLGKAKVGAIEGLINKPKGRPTLAPESDKRPAMNINADSFDEM